MVDEYKLTQDTNNLAEHLRILKIEQQQVAADLGKQQDDLTRLVLAVKEYQGKVDELVNKRTTLIGEIHDFQVEYDVQRSTKESELSRIQRDHDKDIAGKNADLLARELALQEEESLAAQTFEAKMNAINALDKQIADMTTVAANLNDSITSLENHLASKQEDYQAIQKSIELLRTTFTTDQESYAKQVALKVKHLEDLDAEIAKKQEEVKEPSAKLANDILSFNRQKKDLQAFESRLRTIWKKNFPNTIMN